MDKYLLLNVNSDESVLAVVEDKLLSDLIIEDNFKSEFVGEIYKGTIKNIVSSINGIFLDIGSIQNAFLRYDDLIDSKKIPTEGQSILVQIIKESTHTKGPLLSEKISFKGKYGILTKGTDYIGVSKKITNEKTRNKLRNLVKDILPHGYGMIIRTESSQVEAEIFLKEVKRLIYDSDIVQKRYHVTKSPGLIYRNSDLSIRCIRDYLDKNVKGLLINDKSIYEKMDKLITEYFPNYKHVIRLYNEKRDLFDEFGVKNEIEKLHLKQIDLKSGGSIVFDYAEALTAIDVNSGSFKKNLSHEDVAFFVNKEAAVEIARQIRLRGIGGIIMIDFIDMKSVRRRKQLIDCLKEELKKDFAKTVVCGMTNLGLVEMTRERTVHSLIYKYYDNCTMCNGRGKVISLKEITKKIYRELYFMRQNCNLSSNIVIECQFEVALYLKNKVTLWNNAFNINISVQANKNLHREVYSILFNKN